MTDVFEDRRVLLVSTNHAPEHAGIAPYATLTAEHLAAHGADVDVDVLTGMPHYPGWRVHDGYRRRRRLVENRGGVRVHRRRGFVPARQTALLGAAHETSFLAHGSIRPPAGRPDVVIGQMPTLAGGVIGGRLARRHRVPHVVEALAR